MAMKDKNPAWLRWLMLASGLGLCLSMRADIAKYAHIATLGIFGPERWTEVIADKRFMWTTQGTWAATFFYQFATWKWNSDRKKKVPLLADGMFISVLALLWVCLPVLIRPMSGRMLVVWIILMPVLVCGTAYQWRTVWKSRKKNKS